MLTYKNHKEKYIMASFFKETVRYLVWTCRDPMTMFTDSRDPMFNSRDPNRVPKTPLKNLMMDLTFETLVLVSIARSFMKLA